MTTVETGTTDLKSGSLGGQGLSQTGASGPSLSQIGINADKLPTSSLATGLDTTTEPVNNTYTYIFAAVLSVVLILLLYYAYSRFVTNTIEEPMTKGTEQERDDPVIDFNLREAIKDLQNMQKNVMATLSENSEF